MENREGGRKGGKYKYIVVCTRESKAVREQWSLLAIVRARKNTYSEQKEKPLF